MRPQPLSYCSFEGFFLLAFFAFCSLCQVGLPSLLELKRVIETPEGVQRDLSSWCDDLFSLSPRPTICSPQLDFKCQ